MRLMPHVILVPRQTSFSKGAPIDIRMFARAAALVLLTVAAAGFWTWGWEIPTAFFHGGVGFLFLYVGFLHKDEAFVRQMVGGLGALMLLVKAIMIVTPLTWGGHLLHGPIEITCLVVGVGSIAAAQFLHS